MITSLIYVSKSCIERSAASAELDSIVACSIDRNRLLEVRGALIFTERHFAQVLEGPRAGVDALMASIRRDPRHKDLTVICEVETDDYRFPSWTLAYRGGASYMDQQILALLRPRDETYADEGARLYALIRKMAIESLDGGAPLGRPSKR